MSAQIGVLDASFVPNANLSAKQYYLVKIVTSQCVGLGAAVTDKVIGVLQNKPTGSPEAAVVRMLGTSKVITGSAFAAGVQVCSDASGKAIVADADLDWVIGISLEASAATNDIIEILLVHFQANVA